MVEILTFIGAICYVFAAFLVGALVAVVVVIMTIADIVTKILIVLAPIALTLLVAVGVFILGLIAGYAIFHAAIGLYYLVTYLVDTIIINPTQNYCNKDLSFLYKNRTISIFKYLFMTRLDREKIIVFMKSNIIKTFFKQKKISLNDVTELTKKEPFHRDQYLHPYKQNFIIRQWENIISNRVENFENNNINGLFLKNKLTFKQAAYASSDTCKSLQSEFILKAFEKNEIDFDTIENRKIFSREAIDALSNSYIKSLLKENKLSLETYLSLNANIIEALKLENIYNLYKEEKITIEELKNYTTNDISALNHTNIYDLIKKNYITLEITKKCGPNTIKALCLDCIATMYKNDKISLEELSKIKDSSILFLNDETSAQLLVEGHITFDQIQSLTSIYEISVIQKILLNHKILKLCKEKIITFDELSSEFDRFDLIDDTVKKLTEKLTSEPNFQLINSKRITFIQLRKLNKNALNFIVKDNGLNLSQKVSEDEIKALENLSCENISKLVNKNLLTFNQLKLLTPNIINALKKDNILQLFNANKITFEHLRKYTLEDLKSLENKNIRHLFENYKLSIDNIKQCSHDDFLQALFNISFIMDSIVHHHNTFADLLKIKHYNMSMNTSIINNNFLQYLSLLEHKQILTSKPSPSILRKLIDDHNKLVEASLMNQERINLAQSTHTKSTEEVFSSFVIQLKKKYIYSYQVNDFIYVQIRNLNELLIRYEKHSKSKFEDLGKEKLFIQKLYNCDKEIYHEKKSDSSIQMLLALSYKAACANQINLEQYAKLMYEAFFEIRRGNNFDANDVDDGLEDKTICVRGAFNKILEKMVGFLPGCDLVHVTPKIVLHKLDALVRGKIKAFVQENIQELLTIHINNRKDYIFDSIQDEILNELIEEVGEENAQPGIDSYPHYKEYNEELHNLISEEIKRFTPNVSRQSETNESLVGQNGLFANQNNNDDESEAWMNFNGID